MAALSSGCLAGCAQACQLVCPTRRVHPRSAPSSLPLLPGSLRLQIAQFAPATTLARFCVCCKEHQDFVRASAVERMQCLAPEHTRSLRPQLLRLAVLEDLLLRRGVDNAVCAQITVDSRQRTWNWAFVISHQCPSRQLLPSLPIAARWAVIVGNRMDLVFEDYERCQAAVEPRAAVCMERDVHRTPICGPHMWASLRRLLTAVVGACRTHRYTGGMNFVAGAILHMFDGDEFLAFLTLANFFWQTQMFGEENSHGQRQLEVCLQSLEERLASEQPWLARALDERQVQVAMYAAGPLALGFLPLGAHFPKPARTFWEEQILTARTPDVLNSRLVTEAMRRIVRVQPALEELWKQNRKDEFEESLRILSDALKARVDA